MKIALALFTGIEIEKKSNILLTFSNDLESHFKNKEYGTDIKSIIIGIICVSINFEQFFIPRKPKYTKEKMVKSQATLREFEIEKCLEYDVKIDFETFKNGTEDECQKLLAKEILQSLKVLDDMKAKIKNFDTQKFKTDLEEFLSAK